METSPAVSRPLLEEMAEGIFAYLANKRQMAPGPNQFEAERSSPFGRRQHPERTLEPRSGS